MPVDAGRFLSWRHGSLPAHIRPQRPQPGQGTCQIGQVGFGLGLDESSVEADRSLYQGQGLRDPALLGQPPSCAEQAQRVADGASLRDFPRATATRLLLAYARSVTRPSSRSPSCGSADVTDGRRPMAERTPRRRRREFARIKRVSLEWTLPSPSPGWATSTRNSRCQELDRRSRRGRLSSNQYIGFVDIAALCCDVMLSGITRDDRYECGSASMVHVPGAAGGRPGRARRPVSGRVHWMGGRLGR